MQVTVNGKQMTIPDGCPIVGLLDCLALEGRLAVEVNGAIVPRSEFDGFSLKPNDRIEIVRAIGGG